MRREVGELVDAIVAHRNTMLQPTPDGAGYTSAARNDRNLDAAGPDRRIPDARSE